MIISVKVLLASSFVGAVVPPLHLVDAKKPFAVAMFQPPPGARRAAGLAFPRPSGPASGTIPSLTCHVIVIPADPKIDPKMVVEAPKAIDPKIVQRSACADPIKD